MITCNLGADADRNRENLPLVSAKASGDVILGLLHLRPGVQLIGRARTR